MRAEEHEGTADAAALRARLQQVYWIGGGSGAGKSTIARRIAALHGLQVYSTDEVMADHASRGTPEDAPYLSRSRTMDMDQRQVGANREGHSIDLFTKAIDQLASDQVSVRHGGVYALEQRSELDARYRGHAHALLTAFVRRHASWPPANPESEVSTDRRPLQGGVADDIGAALGALRRRAMILDGAGSELERVDLRDAELDGLDIPHVCFAHSTLEGAHLVGATLSDTVLRKSDLSGADLRGADMSRADLDGAILLGSDLTNAELRDASLVGVIADNTTTWPHGFTPPSTGPET